MKNASKNVSQFDFGKTTAWAKQLYDSRWYLTKYKKIADLSQHVQSWEIFK